LMTMSVIVWETVLCIMPLKGASGKGKRVANGAVSPKRWWIVGRLSLADASLKRKRGCEMSIGEIAEKRNTRDLLKRVGG